MSGNYDLDMGLGTVDYGMVQDGMKCGDQMICMNQTCVKTQPMKTYMRCPVDASNLECSNRGVSTKGHFTGKLP